MWENEWASIYNKDRRLSMLLRDLIGLDIITKPKPTYERFWDAFKHVIKENNIRELRWNIYYLVINFGNIFKNNYHFIFNRICENIDNIGIDGVKTMMEVILHDEFKGVFKMNKLRFIKIEIMIKLLNYWVDIIEKGYVNNIKGFNKYLHKLQHLDEIYSGFDVGKEILFVSYSIERAVKNNNWTSTMNGIKTIISIILRSFENETKK